MPAIGGPARDVWTRAARFVPIAVAIASFAASVRALYAGHPHEDAYILFEYARHFAGGDGIVYFAGGPHAEGATDFLWMVAIAALVRVGVDVAIAAAAWNAIGAGVVSMLCVRVASRAGARGPLALVAALASAWILATSASLAGWAGFGTLFDAALLLACAELALDRGERAARWTPFAALAVALVRPDGVVLAVALGVVSIARAREHRRVALRSAAIAVAFGAAYFAWRWSYFGSPLPLPLYVKSNGVEPFSIGALLTRPSAVLPGLAPTSQWSTSRLGPAPMLAAIVAILLVAGRARRAVAKDAWPLALVAALHVALLAFGRQTQNHAFRFQAPAVALLAFAAWRLASTVAFDDARSPAKRACAALAFLAAVSVPATRVADQIAWNERAKTYMDVFPSRLDALLPAHATIALTEAGRLAFRTSARTIDVVGLDDPEHARTPPSVERLAALAPDVVQMHVADALSLERLATTPIASVIDVSATELDACVLPSARDVYEHGLARYSAGRVPESVAPAVLARFLATSGRYRVVAVRYFDAYAHVWGFRDDLANVDAIVAELRASTARDAWRSYADLAGFAGTR